MGDPPIRVAAPPAALLDFDPGELTAGFGRHPVAMRHELAGARGFTVDDLVDVAGRVVDCTLQGTRAQVPLVTPDGVPSFVGDPAEIARTIDSVDGRLGVLFLQAVPRYREVMHACLGQVLDVVGTPEGLPDRLETSVFLAPAHAIVPVHFDSHHNVLLQLAGTKVVTVGMFANPGAQARAFEFGCRSGKRMGASVPPAVAEFCLGPGDGLYIPPYTFHWVTGGPETSAALSCSFSTPVTLRAEQVYACNAQLRRVGLRPRPPGRSVRRDRLKVAALRAAQAARSR